MTHPHFVPPNSVPPQPGPPAFVTPPNVAPVPAQETSLLEATSEMPLVRGPQTDAEEPAAEASEQTDTLTEAEAGGETAGAAETDDAPEAAADAQAETDPEAVAETEAEVAAVADAETDTAADAYTDDPLGEPEPQADTGDGGDVSAEAVHHGAAAPPDLEEAEIGTADALAESTEEEPEPASAEIDDAASLDDPMPEDDTEAEGEPEATTTGAPEAVVEESVDDAYEEHYDDVDEDDAARLRPGDVDDAVIAIWDPEVAERYRDAWRDIQAHFVDEPEAALGEAQDLVAEAVQALADALLAEQVSLDPHEENDTPDTEALRIAMRGYRDFLDRVLAL